MATCLLYSALAGADVALSAATARTVLSVIAAAGRIVELSEFSVSLDGTAADREGVLVELCKCTQATAGTSSAATITQICGPTVAIAATARHSYTAGNEPTAVTPFDEYLVEPKSGLLVQKFALGEMPVSDVADSLLLRLTAPAAVNARAYMHFRE